VSNESVVTTHTGAVRRHAAPSAGTAWSQAPGLAVRGGLVGMAESVPGISGGTVALVVGLYDRLLEAASQVVHALRELVGGVVRGEGLRPARRALRAVDWRFLVPVALGMVTVLLVSLSVIAPLLESQPVVMRSIFFGMIAVSVLVPLRMMPSRFRGLDVVLLLGGAVAAFVLSGLPPAEVADPSLWYVFLGAAVAINALVLPGISGSFLLVVMGLYVPVQQALADRDLAFVGAFMLGAAVGLGSFVKLLHWLLESRRQGTMAVLAGLMVGSLRALWPWQDADGALQAPPDAAALVGPVLLAVAGAAVVGAALWWEASRAVDDA
jgi:putative membrane protein